MNCIVGKSKHTERIIPYITTEGIKTYDKRIADEFSHFCVNMASNLANKILESRKNVQEYISDIPHTLNSLAVGKIGYIEIESIINSLPAKSSSGHDGVSNILLKHLSRAISYLLAIIFNQSLSSGVYPEKNEDSRNSAVI